MKNRQACQATGPEDLISFSGVFALLEHHGRNAMCNCEMVDCPEVNSVPLCCKLDSLDELDPRSSS